MRDRGASWRRMPLNVAFRGRGTSCADGKRDVSSEMRSGRKARMVRASRSRLPPTKVGVADEMISGVFIRRWSYVRRHSCPRE